MPSSTRRAGSTGPDVGDPPSQRRLLRGRRAHHPRRRLRRPRPRAPGDRGPPSRPRWRPTAPPSRCPGAPTTQFAPVEHSVPMMSLDNAMDSDELHAWGDRTARRLADLGLDLRRPVRVRAQDRRPRRVDPLREGPVRPGGHAGQRSGRRGRHRQRRGHRRRAPSDSAPARPTCSRPGARSTCRSPRSRPSRRGPRPTTRLAAEAGRRPKPVPVNPRNAGAGSLRQKNTAITAGRGLSWWCYQLGEVVGADAPPSHSAALELARWARVSRQSR